MWALVKEIIGTETVAEVGEFPWFFTTETPPNYILIYQHFNRSHVPLEVPSLGVRLHQFRWRDLRVMLCRGWMLMPEPFLQLE